MDINSLLSPSDNPSPSPSTPKVPPMQSPGKQALRTHSGPPRPLKSLSPYPQVATAISSVPQHLLSPKKAPNTSSPLRSPKNITPSNDGQFARISSTQSIDTLADVAAMQNHQPAKSLTPGLHRSHASYESQLSPSTIFPTVAAVSVTSNPRSSLDTAMLDLPVQSVRTDFSGTSLPSQAQQDATSLAAYIAEYPAAYQSHVDLIKILHQGFIDHVYPPASPDAHGEPRSYDLLADLRAARYTMDNLFSVGEELWAGWIQDESMLARTIDEQVEVWEKSQRAVVEETGSTRLWKMCGDWILHCYKSSREVAQNGGAMSEEEQALGRGVFTWDMVLETWRQAVLCTRSRLNDSHLVWDTYIQLLMDDRRTSSATEMNTTILRTFQARLRTPHANWDTTFQSFSTFVSEAYAHDYENIMASTNRNAAEAKKTWEAREPYETKLQLAQDTGDKIAEYSAFSEYLDWEKTPAKWRKIDYELTNAVYQRAELRFPANAELWEEHVLFVIDEARHSMKLEQPLALLDRATRHCPWSGSLWSQYLLSSEKQGQAFQETQEVKHKATGNGLLDIGGMEEVLKFNTAWCSYLRRRAFRADASDEDLDVAEMGIRSSIENVQELATKRFGLTSNPDPSFRLERLYISYLTEKGSWDSAREAWKNLVTRQGDSWEFWLKYYQWEMMCWSRSVNGERNGASAGRPGPQYATALLKDALGRSTLDWPEKIMQTLISHCEDYEDVEELQVAVLEVKKLGRAVAKIRLLDTADQAVSAVPPQSQQTELKPETLTDAPDSAKRKREDEIEANGETTKKAKTNQEPNGTTSEKGSQRDRENATIVVRGLPEDVTETRIRQFFRDCGTLNSLKLFRNDGTSAVVEFEDKEAAQFALSRNSKAFDDSIITVELGTGSVLFVANYPPAADEKYIRGVFSRFGTIVEVRLPSLITNTHRRFCYVQFEGPTQAQAATELNGQELEKGKKLVAKISDPSRKQERSGALDEGREVHVRNVHWGALEEDLQALFSKFGNVQSVRIPRDLHGRSKGFGFICFEAQDEAEAALEMNGQEFRGRTLRVETATRTGGKRQATTIMNRLDSSTPASMNPSGGADSPGSMSLLSEDADQTTGDRWERTIALMGVPDTVNASRIRALAEKHGRLVKVSLRPDHQGAIIEFQDARDAAKASLHFEGHEIDPGRKVTIGQVSEMMKQKPEKKTDKIQVGKAKTGQKVMQTLGVIRRPGQLAARKPPRLGQRKGLDFRPFGQDERVEDGATVGGKTNDDFRAMLQKE